MRTSLTLCLAAALVSGVSAQTDLQLSFVSMSAAEADQVADGGSNSADELVTALEEDDHVTGESHTLAWEKT